RADIAAFSPICEGVDFTGEIWPIGRAGESLRVGGLKGSGAQCGFFLRPRNQSLAQDSRSHRIPKTRSDLMKACLTALAVLALALQLTACGGGSSSSTSGAPAAPVAAKGIATPKSVSV